MDLRDSDTAGPQFGYIRQVGMAKHLEAEEREESNVIGQNPTSIQ